MEPLRWGVIGTGGIAATFAADLDLTDSGRVVAVGSRHQESADRFADEFAIPHRHASYQELVNIVGRVVAHALWQLLYHCLLHGPHELCWAD